MSASRNLEDRRQNLLVGLVGMQADLIDRNQFECAWRHWSSEDSDTLADVLVEQQLLDANQLYEVQRLVQRKLVKHAGSCEAALAELLDNPIRQTTIALQDRE